MLLGAQRLVQRTFQVNPYAAGGESGQVYKIIQKTWKMTET